MREASDMLLGVMKTLPRVQWLLLAGVLALIVSGCGGRGWREYVGLSSPSDPSVNIRAAEPKWLLIKNPRFGDVPSEPEYVWVEEGKVPTTVKSLIFGKSSLIASPEIVAKYGVSVYYTAPTLIRTFMKWGKDIPARFDLSSLRVLGSVGEPINPEAWVWYHEHIGGGR